MSNLEDLAQRLANGSIDGNHLAGMVERSEITKQERRKITKLSQAYIKQTSIVLTKRQLERRATKEKKMLPKLTRDDRKRKYHDEIEHQRELESAKFTICLGCRKRGHFLKDCPKAKSQSVALPTDLICFNCGSHDHTLKNCLEPRDLSGKLPFATCFVCKQKGHLSRECPENANGMYPKGGCCHICLQKTHLARDCPEKTDEHERLRQELREGVRMGGLVASDDGNRLGGDDMLESSLIQEENDEESDSEQKKKKKRKMKH